MKKLLFFLPIVSAHAVTPVSTSVVGAGGVVPPNASLTAQFVMTGVDTISVTINGINWGRIHAPFKVAYTSQPAGVNNTFVIQWCDFFGRTGTDTFGMMSQVVSRNFPPRMNR